MNQLKVDQILSKVGNGEMDIDEVVLTNDTQPEYVQASDIIWTYREEVAMDHGLHMDDDWDQIEELVLKELENDYGDLNNIYMNYEG